MNAVRNLLCFQQNNLWLRNDCRKGFFFSFQKIKRVQFIFFNQMQTLNKGGVVVFFYQSISNWRSHKEFTLSVQIMQRFFVKYKRSLFVDYNCDCFIQFKINIPQVKTHGIIMMAIELQVKPDANTNKYFVKWQWNSMDYRYSIFITISFGIYGLKSWTNNEICTWCVDIHTTTNQPTKKKYPDDWVKLCRFFSHLVTVSK